jgi:hypothetical protein
LQTSCARQPHAAILSLSLVNVCLGPGPTLSGAQSSGNPWVSTYNGTGCAVFLKISHFHIKPPLKMSLFWVLSSLSQYPLQSTSMLAVRGIRSSLLSLYQWQVVPPSAFADTPPPEAPDYTDHGPKSWAAFPGRDKNAAELRPEGEEGFVPESERPVDCFFLYPTTYGIFSGRRHYNAVSASAHITQGQEIGMI